MWLYDSEEYLGALDGAWNIFFYLYHIFIYTSLIVGQCPGLRDNAGRSDGVRLTQSWKAFVLMVSQPISLSAV